MQLRCQLLPDDCFEVMANLVPSSINAVVTDFPYNNTAQTWDEQPFDLERFFREIGPLLKPGGAIITTSAQPFTNRVMELSPYALSEHLIWLKNRVTGHLNASKRHMRDFEEVLVFRKPGVATFNPQKTAGHERKSVPRRGKNSSEVYKEDRDGGPYDSTERLARSTLEFACAPRSETIHPNQKPLALYTHLIKTYTNEGDFIFEPCAGSATTGAACYFTKRAFLGCESDAEHFRAASARLRATLRQPGLLGAVS